MHALHAFVCGRLQRPSRDACNDIGHPKIANHCVVHASSDDKTDGVTRVLKNTVVR